MPAPGCRKAYLPVRNEKRVGVHVDIERNVVIAHRDPRILDRHPDFEHEIGKEKTEQNRQSHAAEEVEDMADSSREAEPRVQQDQDGDVGREKKTGLEDTPDVVLYAYHQKHQ